MTSLKNSGQFYFYTQDTNEVISLYGFKEEIQKDVEKAISIRNNTKTKRIKKKLNNKIDHLLCRKEEVTIEQLD